MATKSYTCSVEERVRVTLTPKSKKGKEAALDGPPTITVTSGDGTAEVTGPLEVLLTPGPTASATVYSLDALSAGKPVHDDLSLAATPAAAVTSGPGDGTVEDQP